MDAQREWARGKVHVGFDGDVERVVGTMREAAGVHEVLLDDKEVIVPRRDAGGRGGRGGARHHKRGRFAG